MGESCRFAHFFCVETEHCLVNVPFKVRLADEVISAKDNPLEMPPKTFYAIGRIGTDGEFTLAVTDEDMVVFLDKPIVGRQFIRDNGAALGNEMFNDGDKSCRFCISNLLRHLIGVRLHTHLTSLGVHILGFPHHRHTEDGSPRLGASALSLLCFLAIVLVGFPSAEIHLVALHYAIKNNILLCEKGANLMEDKPRGFLRHINVTAQLTGGYTLLMAADKVHMWQWAHLN